MTGPELPPGSGRRLTRAFFARPPEVVARDLLGRVVVSGSGPTTVAVRLTEVEAYAGADDPASHAFRGSTARNAVMFGPAGHLYLYFVYGMHWCANVVTGPVGEASAVLLRGGEVLTGSDLAALRRPGVRRTADLARGPAGLATVLGWGPATNGHDLVTGEEQLRAGRRVADDALSTGPRVGVSVAAQVPWRFWVTGAPGVSAYRAAVRRPRRTGSSSMGD
ncbi:DNA-3-methyladenine glycosylase [Nakamurella sp. YIM 132087]|uniref:Putative 3-methyladenine DNA glycosylase n=1 Tax=Nakamurella alba TaxID=2665158 RepID=A0A7K1FLA9_9ACTN|nr:DNA-3-methyladenine glycosylase [Nakamurella alba]MTD14013.1 DNA-3-methyladenine glycosylase [Nakamurella alba]